MILRSRDREMIIALSRKVRLFSHRQIASHWWELTENGMKNSRRRLNQLVTSGWLATAKVIAESIEVTSAVTTWAPPDPAPDFGKIAWQLQSRWQKQFREIRVFFASRFGANQFGGTSSGRLKKPKQATHDLGVSSVYLSFCLNRPGDANAWLGEDIYAGSRRGQVLPDAMLFEGKSTTPYLAIEFGGAYKKERLEDFHHDCASRKLGYEIW